MTRRILRDHNTFGSSENKLGRSTTLSTGLEEELKARVKRFANIGLPFTKTVIQLLYAIKVDNWFCSIVMCNTLFAKL